MKRDLTNPKAVSHKRAKKYVSKLSDLEKTCRMNHGKNWPIPYLQRVYELARNWRKKGLSKERRTDLNRFVFGKRSVRKDKKTVHLIIECTSGVNSKTRSRWASALLLAQANKIEPVSLPDFLLEEGKGGIAGRAHEYGKLRMAKKKGRKSCKITSALISKKTSFQKPLINKMVAPRVNDNDDWN